MKIRTYFTTLLLFLFFFNGSILFISCVNLNNNLNSVRESCLREHYFISQALAKDLNAVSNRGGAVDTNIEPLFQSYLRYYGKQNVFLELDREGKTLYSSIPDNEGLAGQKPKASQDNRLLSSIKVNGKEYIRVAGTLPAPYSAYALTYLYDLSPLLASWHKLTRILYSTGMVLSLALAVCLVLLLNYVFKPLRQISLASKRIAQGEYEQRIAVTGQDELTEMAESFNQMAGAIQEQIVQLAEQAAQKQFFIDNFAHELRSPLTTIYGYAEYLQKAVLTEEEKISAASYIMAECRRLQNIAYGLLDLAKLRNDEIMFSDINVAALLRSTVEELQQLAAGKQVQLEYECKYNNLSGDFEMLKCLLVNLAENGIKACQQGGTVRIKAACEEGKKMITVQDNGKGMTAEQLLHITEAFYRVDSARSRTEGGAGLGLALCEQIAARHGAVLSFSSQINQGTCAKVFFTES